MPTLHLDLPQPLFMRLLRFALAEQRNVAAQAQRLLVAAIMRLPELDDPPPLDPAAPDTRTPDEVIEAAYPTLDLGLKRRRSRREGERAGAGGLSSGVGGGNGSVRHGPVPRPAPGQEEPLDVA
jgi:hypothetical protein